MKVAYVDSSVLVGFMFNEREIGRIEKRLTNFDELISSSLLEAEIMSAAAREGFSMEDALKVIGSVSLFFANSDLTKELRRIFEIDYIRGADAYHLACALALDPKAEELCFCSLDKKQLTIAKALGFKSI